MRRRMREKERRWGLGWACGKLSLDGGLSGPRRCPNTVAVTLRLLSSAERLAWMTSPRRQCGNRSLNGLWTAALPVRACGGCSPPARLSARPPACLAHVLFIGLSSTLQPFSPRFQLFPFCLALPCFPTTTLSVGCIFCLVC